MIPRIIIVALLIFLPAGVTHAQSVEQLKQKVASLEKELLEAKSVLQSAEQNTKYGISEEDDKREGKNLLERISLGPLKIGGAIRANYVIGDYEKNSSGPSRGGHGGAFELDTFKITTDFKHEQWIAKTDYRFYDGYHFLHTGWLGYNFKDDSQIQMGINRVPFGPADYGVSQSWFFDQHYYVGLSDDMDLGIKYSKPIDKLNIDFAYYVSDEGHWRGSSKDSSRYSYDVVDETGLGYEEEHQFNLRAIYSFNEWRIPTNVGASAQFGLLNSAGSQGDGDHYAASVHMVNNWNNWKLASQLTHYNYNIESYTVQSGVVSNDLIDFGAFDFAYPIAAKAFVPAVSLSYNFKTPNISWLDYVIPYIEFSSIVKDKSDFNNSELLTLGAAWAHDGWYIYTDWAYSNGNFFVGNEKFTEFGANPNNEWQSRFNINFGYYF